jgi:phage tail sheath protein FI
VTMGLVPMVYEFGQVQAFSPKTLFNGTNLGLQTYSVVRTFDWLSKSIMDYLNRMLFQNISKNMEMDIRKELSRFLDQCKREKNIIENFGKVDVERDPNQRDRVNLRVHITPYFPAKSFVIKLDGKGGENPDWKASMEE